MVQSKPSHHPYVGGVNVSTYVLPTEVIMTGLQLRARVVVRVRRLALGVGCGWSVGLGSYPYPMRFKCNPRAMLEANLVYQQHHSQVFDLLESKICFLALIKP